MIKWESPPALEAQVSKESAMQETWVLFLGWKDPLEKEMATHSSILAWGIPWWASQVVLLVKNLPAIEGDVQCGFDPWAGKIPWRGKWQPTQCSCLGNPMDRGAWRVAVHEVAMSQIRLSH